MGQRLVDLGRNPRDRHRHAGRQCKNGHEPRAEPGHQRDDERGCVANGIRSARPPACALAFNPTKSSAPDVTFASYWSQPWGHVDFRGVVRPTLTVNDGRFIDRRFVGYGGGISGDVKPGWFGWAKDDFQFQFTVGNGIGRYMNDSNNAALATNYLVVPATAAAAANILVKPICRVRLSLGYQHWWLPNLRSTVVYGYRLYRLSNAADRADAGDRFEQGVTDCPCQLDLEPGRVHRCRRRIYVGAAPDRSANIKGQEQTLIGKFRVKF